MKRYWKQNATCGAPLDPDMFILGWRPAALRIWRMNTQMDVCFPYRVRWQRRVSGLSDVEEDKLCGNFHLVLALFSFIRKRVRYSWEIWEPCALSAADLLVFFLFTFLSCHIWAVVLCAELEKRKKERKIVDVTDYMWKKNLVRILKQLIAPLVSVFLHVNTCIPK